MTTEVKDAAVVAAPEIKESIETRATKLQADIKFNDQGNFKFEKDYFEGLFTNPEHIKAFQKERGEIVYALTLANGRAGVDYLKDNKDVDIATATLPIGVDTISVSVQRKAEVGFGSAEKQTKYGYTNAKVITGGVSSSSGQLKAIRTSIGELAAKELA